MSKKTPDISEITLMELQERPFPLPPDYRITLSTQAYESMTNHALENTEVELCGVLIGEVFKDKNGPFLEISDAIRGEHAVHQGSQVTFTHETWTYINNIKDSKFPDKRIVGWYHTHPRFGIFLSSQDMFIHENFFNLPWQTAFVIDPVSGDEGFFVWQNGSSILVEQYWIEGKKKVIRSQTDDEQIKRKESKDEIAESVLKQSKKGIQPLHFLIGLLIIGFLLAANYISMNKHFDIVLKSLTSQRHHSIKAEDIKNKLIQNKLLSNLNIGINNKGGYIWCSGEVYTLYHKELIAKALSSIEGVEAIDLRGIVVTHQYITSTGESLSKIAEKVYGNPDNWKDIFKVNHEKISNPHEIQPFMTLLLPEIKIGFLNL